MKYGPIILTSVLGLLVTGCQKAKPLQKIEVRHVRLDRDLIETAAIRSDWRGIRKHILQVNGDALSAQNQSYALYWLGVAQHKLGDIPGARRNWERALERRPDSRLTAMIQRAFQQREVANSYRRVPPNKNTYAPNNHNALGSGSQWVLQLGIFSLKSTADNLVNKLKAQGHQVQTKRSEFNGRTTWKVWAGPFSGNDAYNEKQRLQNAGYAAILKRSESFR